MDIANTKYGPNIMIKVIASLAHHFGGASTRESFVFNAPSPRESKSRVFRPLPNHCWRKDLGTIARQDLWNLWSNVETMRRPRPGCEVDACVCTTAAIIILNCHFQ